MGKLYESNTKFNAHCQLDDEWSKHLTKKRTFYKNGHNFKSNYANLKSKTRNKPQLNVLSKEIKVKYLKKKECFIFSISKV